MCGASRMIAGPGLTRVVWIAARAIAHLAADDESALRLRGCDEREQLRQQLDKARRRRVIVIIARLVDELKDDAVRWPRRIRKLGEHCEPHPTQRVGRNLERVQLVHWIEHGGRPGTARGFGGRLETRKMA